MYVASYTAAAHLRRHAARNKVVSTWSSVAIIDKTIALAVLQGWIKENA
jgi:hypothetical protein